ncbi:uncharacterized protein MONBRDRAFT_34203 [Monosiga brevicollis MX1]|uniref:Transmembrane protein n=1 Tax=Monosiga brevicollis TaxID=81824 RepID=A9VA70_MONBE|nr:uncharacterized protein MONBRDRAFT_34203 [Monosiga brevicollis MX1]EDQ85677.1 predicted protein [Monosiga brevicollis MX1]|eukprot:XP_001749626.1 hypothetical protein [Monosiga brevicollis MX1]
MTLSFSLHLRPFLCLSLLFNVIPLFCPSFPTSLPHHPSLLLSLSPTAHTSSVFSFSLSCRWSLVAGPLTPVVLFNPSPCPPCPAYFKDYCNEEELIDAMAAARVFATARALARRAPSTLAALGQAQQARVALPTLVAKRTLFGFGVPTEERPAQAETPWYKRQATDDYAEFNEIISVEERQERIAMTDEILACHEKGVVPDTDLYSRLLNMLMKWDDREGVMNAREVAVEMNVALSPELLQKVDDYLSDAERRLSRLEVQNNRLSSCLHRSFLGHFSRATCTNHSNRCRSPGSASSQQTLANPDQHCRVVVTQRSLRRSFPPAQVCSTSAGAFAKTIMALSRAWLFPLAFGATLGGYYAMFKLRKDVPFVTEGKAERAEQAREAAEAFRATVAQKANVDLK